MGIQPINRSLRVEPRGFVRFDVDVSNMLVGIASERKFQTRKSKVRNDRLQFSSIYTYRVYVLQIDVRNIFPYFARPFIEFRVPSRTPDNGTMFSNLCDASNVSSYYVRWNPGEYAASGKTCQPKLRHAAQRRRRCRRSSYSLFLSNYRGRSIAKLAFRIHRRRPNERSAKKAWNYIDRTKVRYGLEDRN